MKTGICYPCTVDGNYQCDLLSNGAPCTQYRDKIINRGKSCICVDTTKTIEEYRADAERDRQNTLAKSNQQREAMVLSAQNQRQQTINSPAYGQQYPPQQPMIQYPAYQQPPQTPPGMVMVPAQYVVQAPYGQPSQSFHFGHYNPNAGMHQFTGSGPAQGQVHMSKGQKRAKKQRAVKRQGALQQNHQLPPPRNSDPPQPGNFQQQLLMNQESQRQAQMSNNRERGREHGDDAETRDRTDEVASQTSAALEEARLEYQRRLKINQWTAENQKGPNNDKIHRPTVLAGQGGQHLLTLPGLQAIRDGSNTGGVGGVPADGSPRNRPL
ncbi:uncharacterized protein LTR77_010093 [Saxophila tyrrhenica]|uniref:Uncharacterized protein n=1 Tax=Saxophila tyrrhenica TaxID=1690608 RepID=A0AAV9NWW4_9PEZI|nr:hypothetical protein LTR77_010093 [Saxophila tyrrhenica]